MAILNGLLASCTLGVNNDYHPVSYNSDGTVATANNSNWFYMVKPGTYTIGSLQINNNSLITANISIAHFTNTVPQLSIGCSYHWIYSNYLVIPNSSLSIPVLMGDSEKIGIVLNNASDVSFILTGTNRPVIANIKYGVLFSSCVVNTNDIPTLATVNASLTASTPSTYNTDGTLTVQPATPSPDLLYVVPDGKCSTGILRIITLNSTSSSDAINIPMTVYHCDNTIVAGSTPPERNIIASNASIIAGSCYNVKINANAGETIWASLPNTPNLAYNLHFSGITRPIS